MATEKIHKAVATASDELAKHLPPGMAEHSTLIVYAAGGSVALLTLRALTRKFYKCAARGGCGLPLKTSRALRRQNVPGCPPRLPLALLRPQAARRAPGPHAVLWRRCRTPPPPSRPPDALAGATPSTLAAPAR